jgi:hypothetical protein
MFLFLSYTAVDAGSTVFSFPAGLTHGPVPPLPVVVVKLPAVTPPSRMWMTRPMIATMMDTALAIS